MSKIGGFLQALLTRLVPAVLTALGVVLITVGLLSYADSTTAGVLPTPSPSEVALPTPSFTIDLPSAAPSGAAASPAPSPSGSAATAVATRVVIPALQIDLPVVAPPSGYPYCNVAMYLESPGLGQPGQGRATYLFAHARDGMFGPIYNLVTVDRTPNKMVGMLVQVYTSDNKLYLYEITDVYPHQLNIDRATSATSEQLWLQTSEGPHGTIPKTQVLAMPLSVGAADPADAHPKARPVVCG
jgi:Sortase domain